MTCAMDPEPSGRQRSAASAQAMLRADYVRSRQLPGGAANRFGCGIFHEACGHLLENHPGGAGGITPFAEQVGSPIALRRSRRSIEASATLLPQPFDGRRKAWRLSATC